MTSSQVGNAQTYESSDQKTSKSTGTKPSDFAYEVGVKNSHKDTDSKDQRTIANRLAAAEKKDKERPDHSEDSDPRAPALKHGNEPSKGAKIDAELQADDELYLKQKGKKDKDTLPGKK
ncbi:hypothetical protein BZA05DRAFT_476185 [Tricharina praecox]|uniref:uncharacterized protein n=1 Tax=Tricharina praecox TaxID=43433 RepID=UPI0022210804|nr:uncharacterized protein BZA05DRAFT_476185 [Tricharina praecox]KAI5846068.1 hypothetical protein BZA05DRAFT_476185 [Tricharina praecox]